MIQTFVDVLSKFVVRSEVYMIQSKSSCSFTADRLPRIESAMETRRCVVGFMCS